MVTRAVWFVAVLAAGSLHGCSCEPTRLSAGDPFLLGPGNLNGPPDSVGFQVVTLPRGAADALLGDGIPISFVDSSSDYL